MNWKDKLAQVGERAKAGLDGKADAAIEQYLPQIRQLFAEKVGPAISQVLADDTQLTRYSKTVYSLLPGVARLVVKEDAFVSFCFTHRAKLLKPGDDGAI